MTAEPLKPQLRKIHLTLPMIAERLQKLANRFMEKADEEIAFELTALSLHVAAHAPSGSPRNEVLSRLEGEWHSGPDTDEHVYRLLAEAFDAGSVASQEASFEQEAELCRRIAIRLSELGFAFAVDHKNRTFSIDPEDEDETSQEEDILGDGSNLAPLSKCVCCGVNDVVVDGTICAGCGASQEVAQPIPSIADVSDHNPNDPSCKACGSAMGWKCLSCGSTPEPTQEAAMTLEQFIKENADFGPLMPSDIQGIARLIRKYEAGTPAKWNDVKISEAYNLAARHKAENHRTRPVRVWADIDVGISWLVDYLNSLKGVRTHASCQGTTNYPAYVMASWPAEIEARLREGYDVELLGENWGYIRPRSVKTNEAGTPAKE
jgi:hypothetical protein